MAMVRRFNRNDSGLVGLLMIFGFLLILMLFVFIFFFVQMIVQNMLPICIGIGFVIAVPILAKTLYHRQTGQQYDQGGRSQ